MAVIRFDPVVTHPRTTEWAALSVARTVLRHLAQAAEAPSDRAAAVLALEKIAVILGERPVGGGRI